MGDVKTKTQAWAAEIEDTEGVYKAPTSSTKFIRTLSEGAEMPPTKNQIERNIFNGSIGKNASLDGQRGVSATLPVEAKASAVEGSAPEYDSLMMSALGSKRSISSPVTTGTDHTTSVIKVPDTTVFRVNEIIMLKEAGKYHVSPIKSIDADNDEIELLRPASSAFTDGVVISKVTNYTCADTGHPSLSISRYFENAILHLAKGCKATSVSLEGFTTEGLPSWNFGFQGMDWDAKQEAAPFAPAYDSQRPPLVLDGYVFMDGQEICITELTFSLENTVSKKACIGAENGVDGQTTVERVVSGSINPYMRNDSIANMTKFRNNTPFSVFAFAKIPSSTPGEFSGVVAIYMPNCTMSEIANADSEGLMVETISFSANRGETGTINEVYIAFI